MKTSPEQLARELPAALEREHALLPLLRRLGVPEAELRVLEGDEHLLRILAQAAKDATDPSARRELEEVLAWHAARLARVAGEATHPGGTP